MGRTVALSRGVAWSAEPDLPGDERCQDPHSEAGEEVRRLGSPADAGTFAEVMQGDKAVPFHNRVCRRNQGFLELKAKNASWT